MFGAILTSKLGLAGIALGLVLMLFGIQEVRLRSAQHAVIAMKAAETAARASVQAHEATAAAISSKAQTDLSASQVQVVTRFKTLVQRIPQEIPEGADRDCVVPSGFVSLWNAGAQP